jgi:hypothetical protein
MGELKKVMKVIPTDNPKTKLYKKVYVEQPKVYSGEQGAKAMKIDSQASITKQLNMMRKAILTGDLTELAKFDRFIDKVL